MCNKYEGWSNRETWATALHIDNDTQLLGAVLELSDQPNLDDRLEQFVDQILDVDAFHTNGVMVSRSAWIMLHDIGSLYRVNWRELAEHYQVKSAEILEFITTPGRG
jgi:hypothetical protein